MRLRCVSAVEVSGQACLPFLVFEAYGFGGSGFGDRVSCRLALVRVLTSLVERPWLFRGLQTVLVVSICQVRLLNTHLHIYSYK